MKTCIELIGFIFIIIVSFISFGLVIQFLLSLIGVNLELGKVIVLLAILSVLKLFLS